MPSERAINDQGDIVLYDQQSNSWVPADTAQHETTGRKVYFDPADNQWLAHPEDEYSQAESLLMGGLDEATFGTADEVSSWVQSQFSDESYEDILDRRREQFKQSRGDNPYYYMGGQVVGGALGGGGLGAAVRGARYLGKAGRALNAGVDKLPLGAQMMLGGGAQAGLSGYGAGEGGAGERAERALTEVPWGIGGGLAGYGAKKAIDIYRWARKPVQRSADEALRGARQADVEAGYRGPTDAEIIESGAPVSNLDRAGPAVQRLARGAVTESDEAALRMQNQLDAANQGQQDRFLEFFEPYGGNANPVEARAAARQQGRAAAEPYYTEAYEKGQNVITPKLQRLTSSDDVAEAMQRANRKMSSKMAARGEGTFNPRANITPDGRVEFRRSPQGAAIYPDLEYMDEVKKSLDGMASEAARKGNYDEEAYLRDLSRQWRDELDSVVPEYADARAAAQKYLGADNAFEAGQEFAKPNMRSHQEMQAAWNKFTPEEKDTFRRGYAADTAGMIRGFRSGRDVVEFFNSKRQIEKLKMVLPEADFKRFEARMKVEAAISQSAKSMRTGRAGQVMDNVNAPRGLIQGGADALAASSGSPWIHHAGRVMDAMLGRRVSRHEATSRQKVANELIEMLASDDPAVVDAAIDRVAKNEEYMKNLTNFLKAPSVGAAQTVGGQVGDFVTGGDR